MNVLALDLGTRYCGWALGKPGALSFGTLRFSKNDHIAACEAFGRQLTPEHLAEVTKIVAESPIIGGRIDPERFLTCGWMWRHIQISARMAQVELVAVNPTTLKKRATDNGHAKDPEMIKAAKALGHAVKNDHEADAVLLLEHFADPTMLRLVA